MLTFEARLKVSTI